MIHIGSGSQDLNLKVIPRMYLANTNPQFGIALTRWCIMFFYYYISYRPLLLENIYNHGQVSIIVGKVINCCL